MNGVVGFTINYKDIAGNDGIPRSSVTTGKAVTIDTKAPVITVTGDNPATVEKGSDYDDAGATANEGTVTSSGTVDTDTVGRYTITYSATDSAGNTGTATRTVNVVDTEPIIDTSNVVITIYDGETELGTANADRAVSWSIDDSETDPSNIDVNIDGSSGVITLSKPIDYDTNTSFKYVITATEADNSGDVVNTTVNVTVKDLIKIDDILTVKEGEQTIGTVTTYNDEIDVTWTIEGTDASLVSVDGSSGVITLDSSANIETDSSYSFVVVATYNDNSANIAKKDVTVTVIDTEPIIDTSNVVITIYDGETELGTANADRAVSWSIDDSETDPSNIDVNIDGSSGVITLSKPIDYDTNTSFKYVITATEADNSGDVVNTTVNVTVEDLIKIDDILTVKEGEQTIGTVTTYNDEIDVTWTIEGTDASLVSVDGSSGVITLDSSANIETDSSYSFVVVATYNDNSANIAKKDVSVTVIDTEPIIDTSNVVITIYDGETELGTANADRAVSWSIDDSETDPSNIDVNIDGSSGVITLSKPIDYDTNTSFKYVVTATEADNSGDVVNTTINVTVEDLIKIDDILTVKEGEQTIGTVTTYNDEIDVTWTIEGTDASLVSVDGSSGVITLDSSANIETDSSYSFVVVATYNDNSANIAKKDVSVTVDP